MDFQSIHSKVMILLELGMNQIHVGIKSMDLWIHSPIWAIFTLTTFQDCGRGRGVKAIASLRYPAQTAEHCRK